MRGYFYGQKKIKEFLDVPVYQQKIAMCVKVQSFYNKTSIKIENDILF